MKQLRVEVISGDNQIVKLFPRNPGGINAAEKYLLSVQKQRLDDPYFTGFKELQKAKQSVNARWPYIGRNKANKRVIKLTEALEAHRKRFQLSEPPALKVDITHVD